MLEVRIFLINVIFLYVLNSQPRSKGLLPFFDKSDLSQLKSTFSFSTVTESDVAKIIKNLPTHKANITGGIPEKVLKLSLNSYLPELTSIINSEITKGTFPNELKINEVTPAFQKSDPLKKENYRPISVLPHVAKIFERILFNQISRFFDDKFSKLLSGFRKNHSTQHALIRMLENWKNALDKKR